MTPQEQSKFARGLAAHAPIIPVLVIEDLAHAVPLARALVAGGLPVLEVTLRSACALDAIAAMSEVEGGIVGAGTILTPADMKAAKAAGARFAVSPGATDRVLAAAEDEALPLLPGAVTASEVMALCSHRTRCRHRPNLARPKSYALLQSQPRARKTPAQHTQPLGYLDSSTPTS